MTKFLGVLRWVLIVLTSIVFLGLGIMKLMGKMSGEFHMWGYPSWFVYVVGVGEILGGVGIYFKKTAKWALLVLLAICIGAILTHVGHHEAWMRPLPAGALLLSVVGMLYLNAKQSAIL